MQNEEFNEADKEATEEQFNGGQEYQVNEQQYLGGDCEEQQKESQQQHDATEQHKESENEEFEQKDVNSQRQLNEDASDLVDETGTDNCSESSFIVYLHGLPYTTTHNEIINFFNDCIIVGGCDGIHFVYGEDGRPNGDAFVELTSEEDVSNAVAKTMKHIGKRYVEVFQSSKEKMDYVLQRLEQSDSFSNDPPKAVESVVRLRGLPYGCSKEEIANFFLGMAIAPNGITILTDDLGRTAGDGYVQFSSADVVDEALKKHKEKIRHRYVEVYKSSLADLQKKTGRPGSWSGNRPGPYDRRSSGFRNSMNFGMNDRSYNMKGTFNYGMRGGYGSGMGNMMGGGVRGGGGGWLGGGDYRSMTGHFLYMKGLPYSATEDDIVKFYQPTVPVKISYEKNHNGRFSGNVHVDFANQTDAKEAMGKHRAMMQHRYIELYYNSHGGRAGKY